MIEAMFYERREDDTVRCRLCNQHCKIEDGERGFCGVRENHGGTLYTLVYGTVIAQHIDPIEKKPLFHFFPGTASFSIGTVGCNFRCSHCQNADISQYPHNYGKIAGEQCQPAEIVAAATVAGCFSIAYTYTEPTIFYEMAYDTAVEAHQAGLKNLFVSNGYLSAKAARHIAPYLDAINIDLKSFSDSFYQDVCGARLKPVLKTIELMRELGVWLETTTLIIPGLNDGEQELRDIARFVKSVGADIPWHVSRFHPAYQLTDRPPTPPATLHRAAEIGREEGLAYVYQGNIPGNEEHTHCHSCGSLVIERYGSKLIRNRLEAGRCPECGARTPGVGMGGTS
ncbi:MAG: AmmeMemoRadiSam system radical SAM enzyme [Syntrophobacteria bacterium]